MDRMPSPRVHAYTDDALGPDDATGVGQRIAAGEISAAEAVDAAIARVAAVNEQLNAVAFDDTDRARQRAVGLRRPRGVFGGVPSCVKSNIHVAGFPLTFGSKAMSTQPKETSGGFATQMLATGTIPVCSTETPPFGWTATTERVGGDVTRNPWNPAYSPGGSSGGTSALVAAGALPFGHGNDGGGSIRIPASACGLVGLKPTRGRTRPDPVSAAMPVDLVSNGVLTRTVRDTANFFHALEQTYRPKTMPPIGLVERGPQRALRVGLTIDSPLGTQPTDAETRRAVEETAARLEELGHEIVPFTPPVPRFFKNDFEDYWSMLAFSIAKQGTRVFGKGFDKTQIDPFTLGLARRFARRSPKIPLVIARLAASRAVYARSFGAFDLVLTPVLAHTTPLIGHLDAELPFEEHYNRLLAYVAFTPLHNATGAPSISVPTGMTADGLPVGVMFSSKFGHERELLEIAFELEEAAPFARIHA